MIICGDAEEKLSEVKSESIDLIVTDPPYGLEFIGENWDVSVPNVGILRESLRVLN